ncbi:hypothetical protein EAF04_008580 [Stromatinia cepivora]|nr:hypothetical protein EAF04_008580 [Stromatinia cepivora]
MSTFSNILPLVLLALPMTIATVDGDFPQSRHSEPQQRDFDSEQRNALAVHLVISVVMLEVFILAMVTLTTTASRIRRQRRIQYVGKIHNRPGAITEASPYRVEDDVYLPAYSYEPVRGEIVVAQPSSTVAKPPPAHGSKTMV